MECVSGFLVYAPQIWLFGIFHAAELDSGFIVGK